MEQVDVSLRAPLRSHTRRYFLNLVLLDVAVPIDADPHSYHVTIIRRRKGEI